LPGRLPTRIVAVTVRFPVSMTDTESSPALAMKSLWVSASTSAPSGFVPTAIVPVTDPDAMSTMDTESPVVTYAVCVVESTAANRGDGPTVMADKREAASTT
jgi:hypothetical protein